ncbi:MAG: DUF1566 domain-containing protein [Nitrosomonadaceae bacterium]|nr:DUF1566 domain-containing protein [Nitrosomonadaceae bacterium]
MFVATSLVLPPLFAGQLAQSKLPYAVPGTGQLVAYGERGEIPRPRKGSAFFGQDATNDLIAPRYLDNKDGTVSDLVTGLVWMKTLGAKMTLSEAQDALAELNKKGPSDWRIPSVKELYSLILYSGRVFGDKSIKLFIDSRFFEQPLGDVNAGEREVDAQVWSATPFNGLTMGRDQSQFGVNFVDGRIKAYPLKDPRTGSPRRMYFRFVRGNPEYGKNDFRANGDGTISDSATGLMWQKGDSRQALSWKNALAYCRKQTTGGFNDWRMPSAKELQTIVDYSVSFQVNARPSASTLFDFSRISGPTSKVDVPYYWTGTTLLDGPRPGSMAMYIVFGTAFAKPIDALVDAHGSGAARADPKARKDGAGTPIYFGPQGDLQVALNYVRCVRPYTGVS